MLRDVTQQPAGANKEEGSRMDVCGGCATKGDARQRHVTTGNMTTSQRTRGKREERYQQTRGDGASIGQGCAFRGGGRVERMRGASMQQPAIKQETTAAAAKVTATAMAMGPPWSSRLRLRRRRWWQQRCCHHRQRISPDRRVG